MAWFGALLTGSIGALMAVCVVMIRRGTLRRNAFMGIRVAATTRSEGAWVAAHRRAAPWWTVVAVVGLVCGVGFLVAALLGASDASVGPWYVGAFVLLTVLVLVPVPGAIRAAKAAGDGNDTPPA